MPKSWRDDEQLFYALVVRTKNEAGWMVPGQKNIRDGWNPAFQIKVMPFNQVIVGRFIDINGNPLADTRVVVSGLGYDTINLWLLGGWLRSDPIFSAIRTKADGEVRIPVPEGTCGQFLPDHPDWIPLRTSWNKETTVFEPTRLSPAGQIEGTVTDSAPESQ